MAEQRIHDEGKELSRREERERRILDAAAELLQKWGYRKTTLEDIAKRASVAKGTIYLSWKTREELFMALIAREQASLYAEIVRRMEEDLVVGITLPGLVKYSILVTLQNPLAKALILQDVDFLGKLIINEYRSTINQVQLQGYMGILNSLRACGVIRADMDLQEQALMVVSVSWGFLLVDPLLPNVFRCSDEQLAERVYLALKRLLEPDIPPTEEQRAAGQRLFREYIERYIMGNNQEGLGETPGTR